MYSQEEQFETIFKKVGSVEYIDTGFNQVRATLKFELTPCAGGHLDFMQIKFLGTSKKWIAKKNL